MKKVLLYILVSFASVQLGFSQVKIVSPSILGTSFIDGGKFQFTCMENEKSIIIKKHILYVYNKKTKFTIIEEYGSSNTVFNIEIATDFLDKENSEYNLNDSVIFFALESSDGLNSSTNNMTGSQPYPASNVLLKASFDDCTSEIKLNWNKYYGWDTQKYSVRYSYTEPTGNLSSPPLFKSLTDTSKIIDNKTLKDITNKKIWFQIAATNGSSTSYSKLISVDTKTPTPPSFINANGTEVLDNGSIKLKFAIDPVRQLNRFIIQGSTDNSIFKTNDTIQIYGKDTTITIPNPQNFYKLSWLNKCNNPIVESNIESKITLSNTYINDGVILNWTPYQSFNGTFHYDIYRIRDGETTKLNNSPLDSATTTFTDIVDPEKLLNKKLVEELIYFVEAFESDDANGLAISNKTLATLQSKPIFPKVIVPNTQGGKSQTNFCITNIESGIYKLIIFDRWGTKVCETDDAITGWNGRYANGNPAPEGMYMYYFKITAAGKSTEFKGTFALVLNKIN